MKALIALPLALGFALAAPVSVYATPKQGFVSWPTGAPCARD
jgi:hypothetical protein